METPDNLPRSKTTGLRKAFGRCVAVAAIAAAIMMFSGLRARRACDVVFESKFSPPHFSTGFVFYPDRHMDGVEPGFKPGWVVTYADGRNYGTTFFVSFMGKILARGTPEAVSTQRSQALQGVEKFRQAFAQADAAVTVGDGFASVASVLGKPITMWTNEDGTIDVFFSYRPSDLGLIAIDWLTNGFSLRVSNNIVVKKEYSYTSIH